MFPIQAVSVRKHEVTRARFFREDRCVQECGVPLSSGYPEIFCIKCSALIVSLYCPSAKCFRVATFILDFNLTGHQHSFTYSSRLSTLITFLHPCWPAVIHLQSSSTKKQLSNPNANPRKDFISCYKKTSEVSNLLRISLTFFHLQVPGILGMQRTGWLQVNTLAGAEKVSCAGEAADEAQRRYLLL